MNYSEVTADYSFKVKGNIKKQEAMQSVIESGIIATNYIKPEIIDKAIEEAGDVTIFKFRVHQYLAKIKDILSDSIITGDEVHQLNALKHQLGLSDELVREIENRFNVTAKKMAQELDVCYEQTDEKVKFIYDEDIFSLSDKDLKDFDIDPQLREEMVEYLKKHYTESDFSNKSISFEQNVKVLVDSFIVHAKLWHYNSIKGFMAHKENPLKDFYEKFFPQLTGFNFEQFRKNDELLKEKCFENNRKGLPENIKKTFIESKLEKLEAAEQKLSDFLKSQYMKYSEHLKPSKEEHLRTLDCLATLKENCVYYDQNGNMESVNPVRNGHSYGYSHLVKDMLRGVEEKPLYLLAVEHSKDFQNAVYRHFEEEVKFEKTKLYSDVFGTEKLRERMILKDETLEDNKSIRYTMEMTDNEISAVFGLRPEIMGVKQWENNQVTITQTRTEQYGVSAEFNYTNLMDADKELVKRVNLPISSQLAKEVLAKTVDIMDSDKSLSEKAMKYGFNTIPEESQIEKYGKEFLSSLKELSSDEPVMVNAKRLINEMKENNDFLKISAIDMYLKQYAKNENEVENFLQKQIKEKELENTKPGKSKADDNFGL